MLVLDTCVFIWLALKPEEISTEANQAIEDGDLCISDITFLELGYLLKKDRISLPCSLTEFCELVLIAYEIEVIGLSPKIIESAMGLSDEVNADPADRIISATAIVNGWQVATPDKNLRRAEEVPTLW
jgi:PIN domain nuclease of toxin-antitoxin system